MSETNKSPQDNDSDKYTWAELFMETALRAIRRVHYEFGIWNVGHQWMKNTFEPYLMNTGRGIELADELTVCAAITQEFLKVPGVWVGGDPKSNILPGKRYYRIDREQFYKDGKKRVDICIQKYKPRATSNDPKPIGKRVFVEAKRARRWISEISGGKAEPQNYLISEVKKDTRKLRAEMGYRKEQGEEIYCHLLVWSAWENGEYSPHKFFRCIAHDLVVGQVRWLPLSWSSMNNRAAPPVVERWLWVAIAEIPSLSHAV